MYRSNVLVCGGTGCTSSNSLQIAEKLKEEIQKNGLEKEVNVITTGCFGLCALGPIMVVYPEGSFYSMVKIEDIPEIVEEHLLKGRIVTRLLYQETVVDDTIKSLNKTAFYAKQKRVALRNCGVIDPEKIDDYIARDGYAALGKVLTEMTPEEVIQTILDSGLRGRGGAGFPTGLKWKFAAGNQADQKYVCCNADEGDPGAFMDRSVLEGDPHSLIEAMAIAGYAIGASKGRVYVRAEYPIAVKRLQIAIDQAREYGLLGEDIFGTGFNFDMELRLGAGAFVCGEETALMTSIEGKRGEPRPRPPFPAVKGLYQKPTILNNVETYANIAQIILNGAEWFASMGTEKSKGTKVFALGGKINHTGLVEIPMGTTLREIVFEIGGGIPNGKKFKAAQTGGPSGGCIPEEHLDVPIDYDNLLAIGSMMGSGGLIVMDEDNCMVDVAKFFLEFTVDESCGKCTPCRIGTKRLLKSQRVRAQWKCSTRWRSFASSSRQTPCAAWDKPLPTPFSQPCAISETSTSLTFRTRSAPQAYVRICSSTQSTERSAQAAASAPESAPFRRFPSPTTPLPARDVPLWKSTPRSVSSAALVWLPVSLKLFIRLKERREYNGNVEYQNQRQRLSG